MARPPPFLRTQSSPTLGPQALLSSTRNSLADTVLDNLPLPHVIIAPTLAIHSINHAARSAFGLPEHRTPFEGQLDKPGSAQLLFADFSGTDHTNEDTLVTPVSPPSSAQPLIKDASNDDSLLLGLLQRLASTNQQNWCSGDAVELRSALGVSWWAEVRVQAILPEAAADPAPRCADSRRGSKLDLVDWSLSSSSRPPTSFDSSADGSRATSPTQTVSGQQTHFSVLLLRPLPNGLAQRSPAVGKQSKPSAVPQLAAAQPKRSDPSAEATPTLTSSHRSDPFGQAYRPVAPERESSVTVRPRDTKHVSPATHVDGIAVARTHKPLRLSALPSPATPPLSSAGTGSSRSSRASMLSNGTVATTSSFTTSVHSQAPSTPPTTVLPTGLPTELIGMGISVTSAGIQLSQSVPIVPGADSSQHSIGAIGAHSESPPGFSARRGSSPRPTALPPPPEAPVTRKPEPSDLLKFAALGSLPKTGIIVADTELSFGFVNDLAREILMGVPVSKHSTSPGPKYRPEHLSDWWNAGFWSADDAWSSLSSGTGTTMSGSTGAGENRSFFPPGSSHSDTRANPFEGKDLMHNAIIASGEAQRLSGKAGLRIGKPSESNRYRTTVAAILARSLINEERREAAMWGNDSKGRWAAAGEVPPTQGVDSSSPGANPSGPSFVGVGTKQGRKPYKVFDSTFSQRIIDPFEPLLEICARKGQQPPVATEDDDDDDSAVSGMIVGIEVEVWEAENVPAPHGTFTKLSAASSRRKRVRRRLVEISAAPILAPTMTGETTQHLGGMLLLKDVTDDGKRLIGWGSGLRQPLKEGVKRKKKASGDAYFKQIIDNMPQMVWTTTPLGSHDFFNQNWYDFTGLEPEQSLGLGWQSPFHEDDMPAAVKAWAHCLETGDPYSVEYRCRRADGAWRWQLGRALPLRSITGEILAWFGTCTDVEEFVQIRSELAKTQEQFRAIIEGADVLIYALDKNENITFFSHPKSSMALGVDLVGKNLKDLWPESPLHDALEGILTGRVPRARLEWIPSIADSRQFFRCSLTPLTEPRPDGKSEIVGAVVVATDVTDLNLAQERLRQSYEDRARLQASEAAANEASRLKSSFVANISHEIRTPIAGMIGMAELLLDETTLAEPHRQAVSKIMRSGEILLEMVGMVLDMGKVEAGKLDLEHRAFKLEDVAGDARIFQIAAIKKNLQFEEQSDTVYSGPVMGDMPRLRQVLSNLLSNAIKFTKDGQVTFRMKQESESRNVVTIRFEVQDTGVGIKDDAIPLLFKPFQQADASTARRFGGTGLGLCIAKNLTELMGGTIALDSKYGVGTKMTVVMPFEKAPMMLEDLPAPSIQAGADLKREETWILVTDDNELNREIITKTLSKMRFNVENASDGLEAIEAVHRRHFDLVLMDGQMHNMDGYEATRRIRASSDPTVANVKIIALTASAIQGDRERALEAGMTDYLSKPVRSKVLESMIVKHLTPPPPQQPSLSRRGSGSATPGKETVALMSMDFSPVLTVDNDNPDSARIPSYPTYSAEAVTSPSSSSTQPQSLPSPSASTTSEDTLKPAAGTPTGDVTQTTSPAKVTQPVVQTAAQ
ncbi:hypothetical protein OIO90_005826 [Microbotryomycetes sp. JL221]|nr:hypothetical protein OIO90_005826 [Microbotryomycetes sp. JL221]